MPAAHHQQQQHPQHMPVLILNALVTCLQETVLLWEQLRPKQTTKEEKEQLVANILKKVSSLQSAADWRSLCR